MKKFLIKYGWIIWLSGTLPFIDITITTKWWWIIVIPTIIFVNLKSEYENTIIK